MDNKMCFLFGHADTPHNVITDIEKAIESHYTKYHTLNFYVGNRGNFDRLAAMAVKRLKMRYPDIRLYLLLAYHPAERMVDLTDGFDNSFYPPLENIPRQYAIVQGNKYMIDTADSIICYVSHPGNTRNLLEYARRRQKKEGINIENVAQNT